MKKKEGTIRTAEAFRQVLTDVVTEHPQIVLDAMAGNPEAVRTSLEKLGFFVADPSIVNTAQVLQARKDAVDTGRLIDGFGGRIRQSMRQYARTVKDVRGNEKVTYLSDPEVEKLAERWILAAIQKNGRNPTTGEDVRELYDKLQEATRAPTTPLTSEEGTSGGVLVPTIVAAEIFEETTERFVLRGLVQVFSSASPLRIPRRVMLVNVYRGAVATDITEDDPNILGSVNLTPERVAAIAYIEPRLAQAAVVGPVRYIISQFAEAIARDDQRVIIAGDPNLLEPTGIMTLPTADTKVYNNAKTATWDNTDNSTRRKAFRTLIYQLSQFHRMSPGIRWIGNSDLIAMAAGLNDNDQRNFFQDAGPGTPEKILNREIVETSAIATSGTPDTTVLVGDMNMYAWQEVPGGLRLDQTTVGGEAWVSDTIGVKVVQEVDGAPVIPPAFGSMPSVNV